MLVCDTCRGLGALPERHERCRNGAKLRHRPCGWHCPWSNNSWYRWWQKRLSVSVSSTVVNCGRADNPCFDCWLVEAPDRRSLNPICNSQGRVTRRSWLVLISPRVTTESNPFLLRFPFKDDRFTDTERKLERLWLSRSLACPKDIQ